MLLNLTEHSKDPLHRQITVQLARRIIEGEIGAGQELPSLRTLAREQHVSKTTVERAYTELASKGLLRLRRRNTPVVADIEPGQRQAIASRIGISPNSMLDALKAFSQRLASLIDPECICDLLKESLGEYLGATGVQVAIRKRPSNRITLLPTDTFGRGLVPGTDDALLEHVDTMESPLLMKDATIEILQSDLGEVLMGRRVEVLYVLKHAGDIQGFVGLGSCRDAHEYSPDDLDLLMLLSDQFATALAMARLYVDSIEKCKLEEELKTAQQIQADLLPESLQNGDALEIAAFTSPSSAVGGDFYDYFALDEYRTGIVVADACGKGMPAAMLISQIQAMVRSEVGNGNTIEKTLASLNRQLHRHAESGFFATLFYGILDRRKGTLKYANAGHDFPVLVRRNGQLTLLSSTGPALGVVEHLDHHAEKVRVHEGDSILLYTDGVTETTSSGGRQYGEIQLRDLLIRNRHRSPDDILNFIKCDVERFSGPEPPDDDRTIVVIKVNRLVEKKRHAA
jgi:serine phosphatase RsbU (regulator of sigma subunit)/DNA-binding transcriptional regulator YhcF (GntR family)